MITKLKELFSPPKFSRYLRKYVVVTLGWSLLVTASLVWNVYQIHENTLLTATAAARATINKDIGFRRWATSHGGVYVPPTKNTPPNPYLKVPHRDVMTSTGKALTLMNPAYILRELQSNFADEYGNRSHLTSLKPLNPRNIADAWETKALQSFEQGNKELLEVQLIEQQPFLRLMQPFIVEPGCLKCHAAQGYKIGDIRGGISTAISLSSYLNQENQQSRKLALSHGLIWLIGVLAQGLTSRREYRLDSKRKRMEVELARRNQELQQVSERLKLATGAANISIWDWDIVANQLIWDDSMYTLYGIRSEDFGGTYQAWAHTIHPEDKVRTEADIQAALRGEYEYAPEFRIIRADGLIRHIKADSKTFRDQHGKPLRMVGTNIDITTRVLADQELERYRQHLEMLVEERTADLSVAKNAAEAANKTKSIFLANMSHELRTPLNAILGFSRLMRANENVSVDQAEDLDIIVRSGEHLLELINNVLDISKIEAGKIELEESSCDLHHLLHEIQSLLNVRAVEKRLYFSMVLSENLPRYVRVDAGKLRQVITNLVGNAIKFTQQGGITLRAELSGRETQQGLWLRFAVEDTGTGISAENCQRIFSPFVQLGQQALVEAGTGLGLTISRQFVELMHGKLQLSSVVDKGSVFYFEIPVLPLAVPANGMSVEQKHRKVIGLAAGQPRYRLLIAEDQFENRLLLHKLLEPLDFELRDACNGEEAVRQYQQWQPDLILMDMRMPVMDGLEATRQIRAEQNGFKVRIIALTAHALEEERLVILAAGCDDCVRKPYRESELFDALIKHLGVHFLYEKDTTAAVASDQEVSVEQLQALPLELLDMLKKALVLLDEEQCIKVAGMISDVNHGLGEKIRDMVEKFQHEQLLQMLNKLLKS